MLGYLPLRQGSRDKPGEVNVVEVIYTNQDVASECGVSREYVRRLTTQGRLPAHDLATTSGLSFYSKPLFSEVVSQVKGMLTRKNPP